MYVVGLTGGIGSGKSTVAACFSELDIDIVNADQLSRDAVLPGSPALQEIADHFGSNILDSDGSLNRRALREIVFNDEQEKQWLEALLHPVIGKLLLEKLAASDSPYAILESPLLLETDQKNLCQRILVVDVSVNTQVQRALDRDGGEENTIRAIIASQIEREQRLAAADDVISNEGTIAAIADAVTELHENYLELARNHAQANG